MKRKRMTQGVTKMTQKKMIRLPGGKVIRNPRFKDRRTVRACPLCNKAVYDSSIICPRCGGKRVARTRKEERMKEELNKGYPWPLYSNPEPVISERVGGYPNPINNPEQMYQGYPAHPATCPYKTCILLKGHESRHKLSGGKTL